MGKVHSLIPIKKGEDAAALFSGGLYEYYQQEAEGCFGGPVKLDIEAYDDKAKVWLSIFNGYLPNKEEVPKVEGVVRALDVGCNTGYNVKEYEKIYGYAEGIDINEELIEYSKLNSSNCHVMSAEDLKYDSGSFSLVLVKDVYEHCREPEKALSEAYRVLVDGGYLVAMIPLDGEPVGIDDVTTHPCFMYDNKSHVWKATYRGVLSRFISQGFTDLEHCVYKHSALFGEERPFGDNVLLIKARKVEGITRVPDIWMLENAYWAAFLTFSCVGNCHYCIQHICKDQFIRARKEYEENKISPAEWVEFYNSLQRHKGQPLSIIGGEPTQYNGFFEVINGIKGYAKTVTTNLKTPLFDDIVSFSQTIEDKSNIRINTSFHPKIISVDEFAHKIHMLRECGFNVDQVAMVDHPTSNYRKYNLEFLHRGIALSPQTFLGKVGDELVPSPNSGLSDYQEHGIHDLELYKLGFSCKEKSDILCMTRRFMVAPDGGIYRCHYHLYSKSGVLGNIKDESLPNNDDFHLCKDFGFCNPCDFPHARFKSMVVDLPNLMLSVIPESSVIDLTEFIHGADEEYKDILLRIVEILYQSSSPYWSLYNDERIKRLVNDYCDSDFLFDNRKAYHLTHLEPLVFRYLSRGVNIFRILEENNIIRYVDALSCYLLNTMNAFSHEIFTGLRAPELVRSYDVTVANIMVTCGLSYRSDGSFFLIEKHTESDIGGNDGEDEQV